MNHTGNDKPTGDEKSKTTEPQEEFISDEPTPSKDISEVSEKDRPPDQPNESK
jgi:hypothetical protein